MSRRKLSKRKNTSAVSILILIVVQLLSRANSFATSWTAGCWLHCPWDCQARILGWVVVPSPPSMGLPRENTGVGCRSFSTVHGIARREYWGGLLFLLHRPWDCQVRILGWVVVPSPPSMGLPGENTGVGCCSFSTAHGIARREYWSGLSFLLHGIFPTQRL